MKNLILALALFSISVLNAQTIKPIEQYFIYNTLDNIYFKDINNHYDKFLGEWEAINGAHYVKIKVTKASKVQEGLSASGRKMMKIRRYIDQIIIECIYKYNGVEVYNTIQDNSNTSNFSVGQILNNPNKLESIYLEPHTGCGRNRNGWLELNYIPSSTPQLQWSRTEEPSIQPESFCPESQVDTSPYKIPANLTFTKL